MPETNTVDEQMLKEVCKVLLHTDLDVIDVLSTLPVYNYEASNYEEAIFYNGLLERCPVCNHWVGSCSMEWNLDEGCCVMCLEYSR